MNYFDENRTEDFEWISDTQLEMFAKAGINPPVGFMEYTAWAVLSEYFKSLVAK